MPVLDRVNTNTRELQDRYTAELLAELQNPSEADDAPLIIVEREALNQPAKHLFCRLAAVGKFDFLATIKGSDASL